ncbi:MAG: hypothetical protein EP330_01995 [Deltaproteobacteria bacterium]|nr:MAG: hypothetical protein EP330_01995 [Deltaproteobacteria bacterium]
MLLFLFGCATYTDDTAPEPETLAVFEMVVGAEPGAEYVAEAQGAAFIGASELEVRIVDRGHPGRLQSSLCATDDPIQGCATLDWSVGEARLELGDARVWLQPDGSVTDEGPATEGSRALGAQTEAWLGAMPPAAPGTWTLTLPVVHLSGNAPDGYRTPAELEISLLAR